MGRLRRVLGVVVVGSLVLVGCGGGDDKVASTTPTTVAGQASGNDGGGSGGGELGTLTASECIEASTTMAEAYGGVMEAMSSLDEGLEDSLALFQRFADKAPSEIKDDFRTVFAAFAEFVEVMQDVNFNPAEGQLPTAEAMAKLEEAGKKLDSSEFTAASGRVSAWFEEQCPDR